MTAALDTAVGRVVHDLRRQGRAVEADRIQAAFADASIADDPATWGRLKGLVSAGMGSLWDSELFPDDPAAEERFRDHLDALYEAAKARSVHR